MVIITIEKVPRKLLEPYKDHPHCEGEIPRGVTLAPKTGHGFRKIEVLIQEKMSQYQTRLVIAHELMHCLQHLTGCEMDEDNADEIDVVMVKALVEKKRGRHSGTA
jgi:hypothetical protein